ncbi:MAG: Ig-like domain-containing protein, partial [Chloroflexota bacterium]|nr:Ig-like domain-containing protein [Chloroflexota bacterium]
GYETISWTRDLTQYETIIDGSGSQTVIGDWDGLQVMKLAVISDGVEYKMWFDGINLLDERQVGLATSGDGISWTKYLTNPVLTGDPGEWDESGEHAPFVLKEGGVYKMWYEGTNQDMVRQLGYATSTNGIDWHKYANNPVLEAGPEGYDQEAAAHGSLLNDGGAYKLWYHAMGDQGPIIAYATSPDGINWSKQGPVLLPDGGSWDGDAVWGPSVLNLDGVYWMWYAGAGPQGPPAVGVITSTNGITWTRFLVGPVVTETTPIGDPHVISDGGKLKMWYQDFEQGVINYAESDDGILWTKSPSNPVLTPGTPGQWGDPVVRFAQGGDGAVLDGFTVTGGNAEAGGGVYASGASITIRNCLIRDNFAHGMPYSYGGGGVSGGPLLTILDSRIINNQVNGGAGGVRGDSVAMVNTLVADNHGDAGIHVNGSLALMNTTVANNDGGVIFNPQVSATLLITNSIVYDNDWSISDEGAGTAQVTYSDVEGGWPGAGNLDAAPLFMDAANGDYHLQGNSPAIDAGTPAGAPPADLDGTPRDAAPDMGAYEYTRFDHDVAIVNVLPSGGVAVNIAFPIRATLYNVGNLAENNVPVICDIEHDGATVYTQTTNSNKIQPLTWQLLEFPTYTPADQGTYTLTCQSKLTGDGRSANNVYSRTLSALPEIADVWTKDNPDDNGDVPSGLDNWYESPDIWVRHKADGGLIHQAPIAGVINTVYLRLRNRGTVPISGTVDVYWIEPSLGVRCGDWAFIDTIAFSNLLPGEVRIVSTPWIPTRTGHTCLQDVVDSPQDPYNRGLECAPQWVPWDNNVEWRNVDIIENPAGGLLGPLDVQQTEVQLVNVYNLPRDVDVIVERMTFPTTGTITVQLPSDLFDRWLAYGEHWDAGIEVLTATKVINITGTVSATIGAIPMDAAEKAQVELIFDGPAGLEFEMTIRERIDGLTVGGTTYQWVIPDTTPPNVVDTFPSNGATDVGLDEPIVITFDEEIGPLNLDLALSPDPGGWRMVWNEAGTVVTATHAGFARGTVYTATVTANDAAANPMVTPLTWPFATERYRIYLPLVIRNS